MRALVPCLASLLLLSGCGNERASQSDDDGIPSLRTEYQTSVGVMPVQYENERAFAITQEALYWYNMLTGTATQISGETFLSEVVPLIEHDEAISQMLTVSEEEARRFYALVFAAVRLRRETEVAELHAVRDSTRFRIIEQHPVLLQNLRK